MATLGEAHDYGLQANGMDAHMSDAGGHGSDAIGSAVFISNLQWWTTDAEVEALTAPYGRILALRFIDDKSCGKSRGMAIVEYAEPGAADACIAGLNGRDINGRPCRVTQQQSRGARTGGGGGDRGGQFAARGERRDGRGADRGRGGRRDDMPPAGGDLMAQAGGMAGMPQGMMMMPGGMMAGGMLPGMMAGMGMPGMDMMQGMQGMMMMGPNGAMMAPFGMPGMPGFKPPPPPGAPPPKKE
ncbi:cleavage and polyadenylation specificity factor subunit 6-like [Micractinium conductrix]|uniref:Cleavage and polyadenylation specificity factor subunit 6-like n=1 Tax=Micractinium conductrix TaxID=554055 RepID=A0A2P6V1S3_9CHLO|nr:cleavage and polyadenylation specificity factor subunit 6-like [Micractinium conductrix]|eukprot:PSC67994.1 cleavage and polyadenylation specificity factor subunit 6-like [Micractinium conductrix]